MRTASNLLENRTTHASARLDGQGMGRSVDRTGTSTVGPTLTCPVKRRDAAWTIVSTLQTLIKRTQTKMDSETSATQTRTMTEFLMSGTTAH